MANLRYGMKEVANVIFFDITTNKPVAFFDTLKVSSIENEAETAEARGGQGNNKLMSWDYGRTATLSISDALLSDTTIAMLSGNEASTGIVSVVGREQLTVTAGGIELDKTAKAGSLSVFAYENGLIGEEIPAVVATGNQYTLTGAADGDEVMAFYQYDTAANEASQITFSGDKFPATYRVVGETLVRGEDGVDRKMQFEVPKAKMQSAFSLTMDAENVATFDFGLEVLIDAKSKDKTLYKLTRMN